MPNVLDVSEKAESTREKNRSKTLMNILGAAFSIRDPAMMKAVRRGSTVEEQRPRANLLERGFPMGKKVDEALDIAYEDVPTYLHAHHSMYMEAPTGLYYLTDVNDRYCAFKTRGGSTRRATISIAARSCLRLPSFWSCRTTTRPYH